MNLIQKMGSEISLIKTITTYPRDNELISETIDFAMCHHVRYFKCSPKYYVVHYGLITITLTS